MSIDTTSITHLVQTASKDVVQGANTYQMEVSEVVVAAQAKAAELIAVGDPRGPIVAAAATAVQSQVNLYPPTALAAAAVAAAAFM